MYTNGFFLCLSPHAADAREGKVTHVNYSPFPKALIILGSLQYNFVFFYIGLLKTDVARSGQRQVSFLKPHLVTVTDTRQTSRKFVVNFFSKEITP